MYSFVPCTEWKQPGQSAWLTGICQFHGQWPELTVKIPRQSCERGRAGMSLCPETHSPNAPDINSMIAEWTAARSVPAGSVQTGSSFSATRIAAPEGLQTGIAVK